MVNDGVPFLTDLHDLLIEHKCNIKIREDNIDIIGKHFKLSFVDTITPDNIIDKIGQLEIHNYKVTAGNETNINETTVNFESRVGDSKAIALYMAKCVLDEKDLYIKKIVEL